MQKASGCACKTQNVLPGTTSELGLRDQDEIELTFGGAWNTLGKDVSRNFFRSGF